MSFHEKRSRAIKSGRRYTRQPLFGFFVCLEPDVWPNRQSQIVIGSIIEVYFVADIGANTDRTGKELDSTTRIKDTIHISVLKC